MENLEDTVLMSLVKSGQHEPFEILIRRHQQSLVNFFRRMGASIDDSEDLLQETFLRLYAYRRKYKPKGKFTSLLYTLARHAWADLLRKMERHEKYEEKAGPVAREMVHIDKAETGMHIQEALTLLSEKLRMVVVLSVYQGLKLREIAEVLDIPVGTVKSRMHLAMNQLHDILEPVFGLQHGQE